MQAGIRERGLKLWVIDAYRVAQDAGMGRRINTIMQTCFFAISGILPHDEAVAAIKKAVDKTYGKKSKRLADLNHRAIEMTLANLHEARWARPGRRRADPAAAGRPARLRARLHPADLPRRGQPPAGVGDARRWQLPHRHRQVREAQHRAGDPEWDRRPVHPVRQVRVRLPALGDPRPRLPGRRGGRGAAHLQARARQEQGFPGRHPHQLPGGAGGLHRLRRLRRGLPDPRQEQHQPPAVNMDPAGPVREQERDNFDFFLKLPDFDRSLLKHGTIPGAMLLDPLFEFSGACAGCGETPYIRLATQLFGDRMLVANATGCSSIYGANLPSTPYTVNGAGRGPAWSNSLFEDNAEFGLGMRLPPTS
jgi:pyruvate-ferredoxin/flavodoxin oxidoreductase